MLLSVGCWLLAVAFGFFFFFYFFFFLNSFFNFCSHACCVFASAQNTFTIVVAAAAAGNVVVVFVFIAIETLLYDVCCRCSLFSPIASCLFAFIFVLYSRALSAFSYSPIIDVKGRVTASVIRRV